MQRDDIACHGERLAFAHAAKLVHRLRDECRRLNRIIILQRFIIAVLAVGIAAGVIWMIYK